MASSAGSAARYNTWISQPLSERTGQYRLKWQKNPLQVIWECKDPISGREGTLSCLLDWSPKFYNNVFLFLGAKTLGTFIEF